MSFQDICCFVVAVVCFSAIAHTVDFDPIDYGKEQWQKHAPTVTQPPETNEHSIPHN